MDPITLPSLPPYTVTEEFSLKPQLSKEAELIGVKDIARILLLGLPEKPLFNHCILKFKDGVKVLLTLSHPEISSIFNSRLFNGNFLVMGISEEQLQSFKDKHRNPKQDIISEEFDNTWVREIYCRAMKELKNREKKQRESKQKEFMKE